ncbi:MAG: hypothetical protein K2X66_17425, partial [Cyanobacteria bacterium]|nr:hypothetical protein [Cyanobacteriota bacterium]
VESAQLVLDLSAENIVIHTHRRIQPSLEDVFVTLTKANIQLEEAMAATKSASSFSASTLLGLADDNAGEVDT